MKFSLTVLPALSAIALAAPAPTLSNKDCVDKKPDGHYTEDFKGCIAYNADEYKYKSTCIWYQPKIKVCKPDIKHPYKGDDEYEKKKDEVSSAFPAPLMRPGRLSNSVDSL
jgi:hypothetical protein